MTGSVEMESVLVHFLLLLALPPLLLGVIQKTKAWCGGRKGAPVLQPYYDLVRLFRKEVVLSRTTSWISLPGQLHLHAVCGKRGRTPLSSMVPDQLCSMHLLRPL